MKTLYSVLRVFVISFIIVFAALAIIYFYLGFSRGDLFAFSYISAVASILMSACLVISGIFRSYLNRFRQDESYSRHTRAILNKVASDLRLLSDQVEYNKNISGSFKQELASLHKSQSNIAALLEEISGNQRHAHDEALVTQKQVEDGSLRLQRMVKAIDAIQDEVAVHRVHGARLATVEADVQAISMIFGQIEEIPKTIAALDAKLSDQIAEMAKTNLVSILRLSELTQYGNDVLSAKELKHVAKDLSEINPVVVGRIYSENDALSLLPLRELRRVSQYTRNLGYWKLSNIVLRRIASVTNSPSDIKALEIREDELAVFEGKIFPQVQGTKSGYEPKAGFILHVVGKVLPKTQSGYTLRTHYSAMAQAKAGYEVAVIALIGESNDHENVLHDLVDEVPYFRLPGIPRNKTKLSMWLQSNVDLLVDFVIRERPEALHAHSDFLNALVATVVGNHFGIPVVYESRGFWEESWLSRTEQSFKISDWKSAGAHLGMPEAYVLRKHMEILLRSKADHVITLAKVMKQHIIDLGSHAEAVSIIPNAVDASQFPIVERDNELIDRLGIPADALVIGYISSIVEYEGIDILIRAFNERVQDELSEAHLLIVGDGAHLDSLKSLVLELGTPRVHFTGRVPHSSILSFYSVIDVFVVPRRPSTVCRLVTPLKPFEAFSTGRAVVLSNVDALVEISQEGECVRIFQAGDHLSLAEELVSLANDPEARKELGKRAANWVRTARSWDANAESYEEIYGRLGVRKSE